MEAEGYLAAAAMGGGPRSPPKWGAAVGTVSLLVLGGSDTGHFPPNSVVWWCRGSAVGSAATSWILITMRTDFDPAAMSRNDFYKLLTAVVVPRPIAWVSTMSHDGTPNLAPAKFCGKWYRSGGR